MQFTTTIAAFMLSSVCSAAVLRRQSFEPQRFVVHSKPKGAECFDHSLGYLFAEYSYGGGYMATLHTGKSDAIQGYIINNALTFGDEYTQGFQLIELSDDAPNAIPQIMSGQDGTPFITVDENNLLGWHSPDGVAISWFGTYLGPHVLTSCILTCNSL